MRVVDDERVGVLRAVPLLDRLAAGLRVVLVLRAAGLAAEADPLEAEELAGFAAVERVLVRFAAVDRLLAEVLRAAGLRAVLLRAVLVLRAAGLRAVVVEDEVRLAAVLEAEELPPRPGTFVSSSLTRLASA